MNISVKIAILDDERNNGDLYSYYVSLPSLTEALLEPAILEVGVMPWVTLPAGRRNILVITKYILNSNRYNYYKKLEIKI